MPTGGTIAAICTPPGNARRAMIRISGDQARVCARTLCAWGDPTRSVHRVAITINNALLPALALWYPKGASYTGECTLELVFVGNPVVARRVLDACLGVEGVRQAEPGEFSARAYLGGRLSLQQAEGVALRIAAHHDEALAAASALLDGSHGHRCNAWADRLAGLLALVEAGVDFTDQEDVVAILPKDLQRHLQTLESDLQTHLGASDGQVVHSDLPRVVLAGAPNAGKSTLMNALLGVHRVMVSGQPGTTRDAIAEELDLSHDLPGVGSVLLIDLAGLGDRAVDAIDAQAQRHARRQIESADAILWCDPTGRFDESQIQLPSKATTIRVRTKSDLPTPDRVDADLSVCAMDGISLGVLRRAIADVACVCSGSGVGAFVPRHRRAMMSAVAGIRAAMAEIDSSSPSIEMPELVAAGLRDALDALGELTGEVTPDDVIGRVFSTFCVGK